MTRPASTKEIADRLEREFPGCVTESDDASITVKPEALFSVAAHLKNTRELDFDYLNYVTAVDFKDHFIVVYNLVSLKNNVSLVLKTRCDNRENPVVPSLVALWKGANLQEREIFDLMGIRFENHPDMKRIVLWDGFTGHPLRKDFAL
jgi:NADH-quinone oxidoreductase subunit C